MIMEKRYFKSGNRNSIAMYKNELQTLYNLPQARGKRQQVKKYIFDFKLIIYQ
jgi:hypothetical protein